MPRPRLYTDAERLERNRARVRTYYHSAKGKATRKAYVERNRPRLRAIQARMRDRNREKLRRKQAEWRAANAEKRKAQKRASYARNIEKERARQKAKYRRLKSV